MYGLLLEAISTCLKAKYGEEKWEEIRKLAGLRHACFSTHETYGEDLIPSIAKAASQVLGESSDDIMDYFGVSFVSFVGQYGYDSILKVLGRHMRDFLNGLDNLHEYLRFSYPKMKPPSFFVENETKSGLTLHYRTRRKGYLHYVKGQLRRVGELFYNTKVDIFVVEESENLEDKTIHVKFRLLFNNVAYKENTRSNVDSVVENIPLRCELLFELFPFHVVFGRNMVVRSVGSALAAVIPDAVGKLLTDVFCLTRPLTKLTWEEVLAHTNNVFELMSIRLVKSDNRADDTPSTASRPGFDVGDDYSNRLHVKGQMLFMSEWESIMFLGTPIMKSLDDMFNSGLYINDLSMHDSSRDLVLAGTQQSAELKLALDQEQEKSRLLEESMKKLDSEMKRTDALLYQMIPKPVADRLRRGEPSVATCQAFDSVTILFSDVVGFTTICSRITPMEVVSMLNAMYTEFDQLSETHDVYKVETIGDAYMAVAGAPTPSEYHALNMCNMALDMLLAMSNLKDPSSQDSMRIRVGIHTGATVAGVVGIKMPRYCLFGDTVNTASRMETNGEAMKIHISETTQQKLQDYPYRTQFRGEIQVKGKGNMKTYWLLGRENDPDRLPRCPFAQLMEQEKQLHAQRTRSHSADLSHRSIYSPVSFDDLNVDSTRKATPKSTPQQSPAHGPAGGAPDSRVESGGLNHVHGKDGPGATPPALGRASSVTSQVGAGTKPTQAVPPTRSGSCSPTPPVVLPPEVTIVSTSVPDHTRQLDPKENHNPGNGMQPQQQQQQQQFHSSSNTNQQNNSRRVNNNDKARHVYPVPTSDVQEPCSPVKHLGSGRNSRTGSGSNVSSARKNSAVSRPQGQGRSISGVGRKDSRPEKSKSKTCSLL